MANFRIAHVTDLHISRYENWLSPFEAEDKAKALSKAALDVLLKRNSRGRVADIFYPSTFNPDVAQSLLRTLHTELSNLDAIIVTGDIATTGDPKDLAFAKEFFDGKMPLEWNSIAGSLPSILKDRKYTFLAMPGNHDRYQGIAKGPSSNEFEKYFGDFWDMERGHTYGVIGGDTHRVRITTLRQENTILAILSADFSLQSSHSAVGAEGYLGQGRVDSKVLVELAFATSSLKEQTSESGLALVLIWAIHFPPKFPKIEPELELLDGEMLVDEASKCGVDCILTGHTHETLLYMAAANGPLPVKIICSGPSSGISKHGMYAFSIIEINDDQGVLKIIPMHYSWDKTEFVQKNFPVHSAA